MAVLGILAVNAQSFAFPSVWYGLPQLNPPVGTAETLAWTAVRVLFEAKFIALFSMLFGVSVSLVGGDGTDAAASRRLRRRLSWLLVFGVLHGALIWYGDILATYALAGLLVGAARRWPAHHLLLGGLALYAVQALIEATAGSIILPGQLEAGRRLADAALSPETGYTGDFAASLEANVRDWTLTIRYGLVSGVVYTASLMLVGLGLFKSGALSRGTPALFHVVVIGVGGVALVLVFWLTARGLFDGLASPAAALADGVNRAAAPLITLAYGSLLVLATRNGGWLAAVLAPVGRMAFTNYLTQSLLMTMIFYGGRGLGLYGEVNRTALWVVVAAVCALQIVWSRLWLARFAYGPLEWLWRSLTEGRAVPIRR